MKTVQHHLRTCDRDALIGSMTFDLLSDQRFLMENKNLTIEEIQLRYRQKLNDYIDYLITLEPVEDNDSILYLYQTLHSTAAGSDLILNRVLLSELKGTINADIYDYGLVDWAEAMGFLVADTPFTQEHIIDVLSILLDELSFFGMDPEQHKEGLDRLHKDLEFSLKDIEEGRYSSADEVFREFGYRPAPPDHIREMLRHDAISAEQEYNLYVRNLERMQILDSLSKDAAE